MLYSQFRGIGGNGLLALILAATLGLAACGGGGGSDSSDPDTNSNTTDDAPSNDTNISASDLQGTWSGSIEPYDSNVVAGQFGPLSITFDSGGDISQVDLDGSTQTGVTGARQSKPTDSDQIFEYRLAGGELDGNTFFLWVNGDSTHAAVVFEDGSMGVIQKGATEGSYGNADAVAGSWSGASVYLIQDNGLTEDGFDDVAGSYAVNGSIVESTDLSFTDPAGEGNDDCLNIKHELDGFNPSYGVYDTAQASGGGGDCPGSTPVPADVYASPDADFMMILAGCEVGDAPLLDECSVAVLNKE